MRSTDAAYHQLLTMCRQWLVGRTGDDASQEDGPAIAAAEWTTIERLAAAHGLEPLLHDLTTNRPGVVRDVPPATAARWERAYYSTRIRNAEALGVLAQLIDRCAADGHDLLALKGPAAMADVYGDIGLRPMADIDVLCRRDDLVAVARVARAMGFTGGEPFLHHVVLHYGDVETGGLLELHFDMYDEVRGRARQLASAWRHRRDATVEDWTFPALSPEDQLVFDVAHGVHDRFDIPLRRIVELAGRLIRQRSSIDWDRLHAQLDEAGLTAAFWQLTGTGERLLNLPLAEARGTKPDDRALDAFADAFVTRSLRHGLGAEVHAGMGLRQRPHAGAAIAYAWRRLVPPLAAAQAAFNAASPMHAAARLPVHAIKTGLDVVRRWRIETRRR